MIEGTPIIQTIVRPVVAADLRQVDGAARDFEVGGRELAPQYGFAIRIRGVYAVGRPFGSARTG